MGPKKSAKDTSYVDEDYWRKSITEAKLDEETWQVKVILFEAAGSDQDRIYLSKFETFSADEKRFVIKNICKTDTIFMIHQLGGEKKVKDDNYRVFEEAQAFLKNKEDVPPEILALVIKHLILKMKEDNLFIRRQRLEVKQGIIRESATMSNKDEVRGTVNVKPPEVEPTPTPTKTKGKKNETLQLPEPDEDKKYNTVLRVRGEEWRDRVYVDDFPLDGPHLYVAITGFVEPLLPQCLIKIGIPLTSVVQIRIDLSAHLEKIPSGLLRATKRGQSQTEILADMSLKFWEDIQAQRIDKAVADIFKNTAFIIFSPPYWNSENLSGNSEKIYDELCFLMYDVQDLTRQHAHYLDNMGVVSIPEETPSDFFYKYYNTLNSDMPFECVTVYSVLDNMLQAVCKAKMKTSEVEISFETEPQTKFGDEEKIEKVEKLVKSVFQSLCNTDAKKKAYRSTFGKEYEDHKEPIVIKYGDLAKYPTFHLGNINLDNIVNTSLHGMPINKLFERQGMPFGEHEAKLNFHVNVLLTCFEREDVESAELKRLMHILSCRKLYDNRSSLKKRHIPLSSLSEFKKVYLKRSVLAEPLKRMSSITCSLSSAAHYFPSMTRSENDYIENLSDDEETKRIKYLFDCPDIRELVSATEIAEGRPHKHLIDDFEYFEDFLGINAYQVLTESFTKFNCVDYKYCEVTDTFVLMFFNSHDVDGIAREEWRCHLMTPLCLQDFFDFDLEEHYDWIQNEEIMYDEKETLHTHSLSKVNIHQAFDVSCLDNLDVGAELLMEGSLKFQTAVFEIEDELSLATEPVTKKTTRSTSTAEQSVRKQKTTSTPKSLDKKQLFTNADKISEDTYRPVKPFYGYDLGDRRVEVFGKDSSFFSKDGTRVTSLYTLIIPRNVEYIALEVVPGDSYNEFWLHRAVGENVSQDISDTCESFRIACKDQMIINIKKETYQITVPVMNMSSSEMTKQKDVKIDDNKSNVIDPLFQTECYYSFITTWPNGLITKSEHETNSSVISHIKQYKILPDSDENMRCISLHGEVIIFKTNGNVEVLKPDGTYINITHYYKKIVDIPEPSTPQHQSEEVLEKNKKGKKVKDVQSKVSADIKQSVEEKPVARTEIALVVDEFEIVESSGLRQKWIGENSIDIEKYLIQVATDYCLREVFSKRMDGTNTFINKDGVHIVTFPNKTRIITYCTVDDFEIYPEWTEEEKQFLDMLKENEPSKSNRSSIGTQQSVIMSDGHESTEIEEENETNVVRTDGYININVIYTIEHENYTTITVNKTEDKIIVDSPNGAQIVAYGNNTFDIALDSLTNATFNGENLHISYEACPECQSFTTCDIKVKSDDLSSVTKDQQKWLVMKDSFCSKVVVNEEGNITMIDQNCSEGSNATNATMEEATAVVEEVTEVLEVKPIDDVPKSEIYEIPHGKCRERYIAKTVKFFVLQRDLSCAELVHHALLDQWKTEHGWQPWYCFNEYDTFGDNRKLVTVLSPLQMTESEKWLMNSFLSNKPKNLTYKDLRDDDVGRKGWYHWMRPYERYLPTTISKPPNVLPPRLPKAYILRTLEQQWTEDKRDTLKGARELTIAILKYRNLLESDMETLLHIPVIDPSSEDERRIDEVVQALGQRIYNDLAERLLEDVRSRAKPNITTEPLVEAQEMSYEYEEEDEALDYAKILEEERRTHISEVESAVPLSPKLKRYWRKREEEYNEEQFYLYLLREGSVPPYFRNVLGGAIWWEMNDTAGKAVTKSERNKMKCVCADKDSLDSAGSSFM